MINFINKRQERGDLKSLSTRSSPKSLFDHIESAPLFQPGEKLIDAINVALTLGAPLLITGEPGTGKTQLAWYLAWYFRMGSDELDPKTGRPGWSQAVYPLAVRSTTTTRDLLYEFDMVKYFREANRSEGQRVQRKDCVNKGQLWKAYESDRPSVMLIDEVDKAPRDFPNDLLHVLDQRWFEVPEIEDKGRPLRVTPSKGSKPLLIITSNSERRLPEPFLRRCIFHHIQLTQELVNAAVQARIKAGALGGLAPGSLDRAIQRFWELRKYGGLRKIPATSELLLWLSILGTMGASLQSLGAPLAELPALSVLIKDSDDLRSL